MILTNDWSFQLMILLFFFSYLQTKIINMKIIQIISYIAGIVWSIFSLNFAIDVLLCNFILIIINVT